VLCGRQASDDDQGVVPALIGEKLGMPLVTFARAVESSGASLKVTRVTPDGDELVEASCPVVVTISNELGEPRFPTTAKKIAARRMKPTIVSVDELSLPPEEREPRVTMTRQFVPTVQGNCEFLSGATPGELADRLIEGLRRDGVLQ
jgi:electron transfer flavoprotein beta subunit